MSLTFVGQHPFAVDAAGNLISRIATIFVRTGTVVTVPPVHALQRVAYTEHLNLQRQTQGLPPLSRDEERRAWAPAVDLIIDGQNILIRPDPSDMPLAFEADELLQELVSKRRIRFLYARETLVQEAIRERGEYWRVSPEPHTDAAIAQTITDSRIGIGGRAIYYYCPITGTRHLTLQEFAGLDALPDAELRQQLAEIRDYAARRNARGNREVEFFAADSGFGARSFAGRDFEQAPASNLRAWHADLAARFRAAVPPAFHQDLPGDLTWRNRMFACVMDGRDDTLSDAAVHGITPEFFRQIRWLPGGHIENGELVFDSAFAEAERNPYDPELRELCDTRVKGFICNYLREFGTLQYVNIGRLAPTMHRRPRASPRRAYIAEVMYHGADKPVVRILRLQQWGIAEHLDEMKELLHAIMEAEDYTEYILDRRLGCWALGLPLPGRIDTQRVRETYYGKNQGYHSTRIWTTYFERAFIDGIATDKIPAARFRDEAFALRFARLLGRAAAPNLVVGRTTLDEGDVIFDTGDEMLILDAAGYPERLVVADHAGTFNEYDRPLESFAAAYALPAKSRLDKVADPAAFATAYVEALTGRLLEMQTEYHRQRRAFDVLFQQSRQGERTFPWRWAKVLARMDSTDVEVLGRRLRECLATCELREQNRK